MCVSTSVNFWTNNIDTSMFISLVRLISVFIVSYSVLLLNCFLRLLACHYQLKGIEIQKFIQSFGETTERIKVYSRCITV